MNDLVTRLRAFNDEACGGGVGVITEAANEIERLRSKEGQMLQLKLSHEEAQLLQATLADAMDVLQGEEREMAQAIIAKLTRAPTE